MGYFESYLDALAADLASTVSGISWIIGDFQTSAPTLLGLPFPIGYITPFNDQVDPRTAGPNGYDMDTFTTPLFILDDLQKYGPPVTSAPGTYMEQPGYRELAGFADQVRAALRANLTLSGFVATSKVLEIKFVPIQLDNVQYRVARVTLQAKQRTFR